MKIATRVLPLLALICFFAVNVSASQVIFTPDVTGSSVIVQDGTMWADLTANLILDPASFTLADNDTQELDFFTLTATGLAWKQNYVIEATLAFLAPPVEGEGSGSGRFSTVLGLLSGGTLTWDPSTIPDYITLADGNQISINFENGCAVGIGNTATVHAYVTNYGGATSVPEPATMLLLGCGLIGLAVIRRKM